MNKVELVNAVAEKANFTKKDADKAVSAVLSAIEEAVAKGDKVALVGFGTFEVKNRTARVGTNPHTGEKIDIPESKYVAFKAGKLLKDAVNK